MKPLLRFLERTRPHFEEGGRLHKMKPVFDAGENFFFAPSTRTPGPAHIRDPLDVKRYMSVVIIALAPAAFLSIYFFGLRMLAMIVVSYAAGGAVEVLFAVVRKEEINEGFLVTGLLFPLILPPTLPLWLVALGVAFGVLVGKEVFGGTGRNLFNPALVGRCFLLLSYPTAMARRWFVPGTGTFGRLTEFVTGADAVTSATPLRVAKQAADALPPAMSDMLFGRTLGCAGETSALAIVLGGLFLLFTRVGNWRTVAATLGSFALLGVGLHLASRGAIFSVARYADYGQPVRALASVGWHLLAGGLMFGAFFMATDPVTSPITNGGKWAFGILIGVATVLIRNLTGFDEGVMFAILLGNIAAPIMDEVAVRWRLRRLRHET